MGDIAPLYKSTYFVISIAENGPYTYKRFSIFKLVITTLIFLVMLSLIQNLPG